MHLRPRGCICSGVHGTSSIAIRACVALDWMRAQAHCPAFARANPTRRCARRTSRWPGTRLPRLRALDQSLSFADDFEDEGNTDMDGATYPPPQAFAEKAHVKSKEQYDEMYRR